MRFRSAAVGLLSALAGCLAAAGARADEAEEADAALKKAVVQIRVWKGADGGARERVGCGVGVLVADRAVMTARHVLFPDRVKTEDRGQLTYELTWPSGAAVQVTFANANARPSKTVGGDAADVGVFTLPEAPAGRPWGVPARVVKAPAKDIPRYDGLIVSYHDLQAADLATCKGEADDQSQGFLDTTAPIEERAYLHGDGHPRVRVNADLSPGYSGSPWVLAPCGTESYCMTGVYVEDLSGDVHGGLLELVAGDGVEDLLVDAGVPVQPFMPAKPPPPPTISLALALAGESYLAGPVYSGRAMGPRGEVLIPVWGIGRRKRPAVGLVVAAAYLRSIDASSTAFVASPVSGQAPLSQLHTSIEQSFELDPGLYLEYGRWLGVFPRVEAGPGWVFTSYVGGQSNATTTTQTVGRVRLALDVPVAKRVMIDVGAAMRAGRVSKVEYDLTSVPGAVTQTSSPAATIAATIDLGLRFLPGDDR